MTGTASLIDLNLRLKIDALVRGECTEDDFVEEIAARSGGVDSAWDVIALIDQRFRRGQIPIALFRSIESKITRRELGASDGTTIDLVTQRIAAPAADADATIPAGAVCAAVAMESQALGQHSTVLVVGRVLRDRYVIEHCLGRGGMGSVYQAVDRFRKGQPGIGVHIALKVLHAGGSAEQRPRQLAKLRREFYSTQALSHPSIVKVFEFDRDEDVAFFTMELIDGELLSNRMRVASPQPLPCADAWKIIRDVASGLAHAHERKVVHADLKPQNIMVTRAGEVRVLDFGSSSDSPDAISALTPAYASCELLEGRAADPRDDLYALACLSYELLTGVHPFQHRRSTEARKLGLVPARPEELSGQQWRALRAGLAWGRDDRPRSVREWMGAFDRQRDPAPKWDPARKWNFKRVGVVAAMLAVCLVVGTIVERVGYRSAATTVTDAPPVLPDGSTPVQASLAADSRAPLTTEAAPSAAVPAAAPDGPAPEPRTEARGAQKIAKSPDTRSARRTTTIGISASSYRLRPDEHFAEIHVIRSVGSAAGTSFTWWTQSGSADPGIDFVPQTKTRAFFLTGRRTARLVVKVLPNTARRRAVNFIVSIGDPTGAALGVANTTVSLPPG